jgi:hypothetical protein
MAVGISSVFAISSSDDITAGQTMTITNPGRTMKVVSVRVKGAGNATVKVQKGDSGAAGVTFAEGAVADNALSGWTELDVTEAQNTLTSANQIRVLVTGGTINAILLECVGSPQQTLTSAIS